jgi:hypothetical protein
VPLGRRRLRAGSSTRSSLLAHDLTLRSPSVP